MSVCVCCLSHSRPSQTTKTTNSLPQHIDSKWDALTLSFYLACSLPLSLSFSHCCILFFFCLFLFCAHFCFHSKRSVLHCCVSVHDILITLLGAQVSATPMHINNINFKYISYKRFESFHRSCSYFLFAIRCSYGATLQFTVDVCTSSNFEANEKQQKYFTLLVWLVGGGGAAAAHSCANHKTHSVHTVYTIANEVLLWLFLFLYRFWCFCFPHIADWIHAIVHMCLYSLSRIALGLHGARARL